MTWAAGLAVAVGLLSVVSTAVAADVDTTAKALGTALLWPLTIITAGAVEHDDRRELLRLVVLAGIAQVFIAAGEALGQWDWLRSGIAACRTDGAYIVRGDRILADWTNRAQGTTGYPTPLAVVLAVSLLVSMFARVVPRSVRPLIWSALIVSIFLTGTRSAFAFCAVPAAVGLVLVVRRFASNRTTLLVRIRVVGVALAGVVAFFARSVAIRGFSLVHRSGMIEPAASLFRLPFDQVLFGSGYNAAERLQAVGLLRVDSATVVDNAYVTQFANTGLVGLGLLSGLLVIGLVIGGLMQKTIVLCIAIAMFSFDLQYRHLLTLLLFTVIGAR